MNQFRDEISKLLQVGMGFCYLNFAEHEVTPPSHDEFGYEPGYSIPRAVRPEFESWMNRCGSMIHRAFGSEHHTYATFLKKREVRLVGFEEERFLDVRNGLLGLLSGLLDDLEAGFVRDPFNPVSLASGLSELRLVCDRFHRVAVQLRRRREDRATLDVNDEYDVQDLLHALLKLYFDDIRPEEWTPSYAGSSARMDFLLKGHGIVIEVKKTRRGLADKQVGKQLIEDVAYYSNHADCRHLVCFVYDPEDRVVNPAAIKRDVEAQARPGLGVEVIVGS